MFMGVSRGEEFLDTLHHSSPWLVRRQSASSEFALLASVLLADFKSAIVTHTAANCKSAETESVKSGEELVKSGCKLFTPRNADKHRGFRMKGEE